MILGVCTRPHSYGEYVKQQSFIKQQGAAMLKVSQGFLFIAAVLVSLASPAVWSNSARTIVPVIAILLEEEPVVDLPIADAGADASVLVGELVMLDGTNSTDPNGLPLTYLWSLVSSPAGSIATLNLNTSPTPEFVLDLPGSYTVQLVVNNGVADSAPDIIIVSNNNRPPLANAGDNQIRLLNQPSTLDGSGSSDIDTDPLSFLWSMSALPSGSVAMLSDATLSSPVFTPDVAGNYVFDLIVNDGQVDSQPDQTQVLAGAALSLDLADTFFGVTRKSDATLSLNVPAPEQGITVTLTTDTDVLGLDTNEIEFQANETEKSFTVTGLSTGTTSVMASSQNIVSASVDVEVSSALVSIGEVPKLSPTISRSLAISLSELAPAGGVSVSLESLDIGIATVSPSTVTIAEGQITPSQNAQVTGVGLGETRLRATATGFAPDERQIEVALAANFAVASLDVPELQSRTIVLEIDAPAPTGGIVFDLEVVGEPFFSSIPSVEIGEGQTQSPPITITGVSEGTANLRASSDGFVDAEAQISVLDAPNIFLRSNGSNSHLVEAFVGLDLQVSARLNWEQSPASAVDIVLSVPENSGVLLASNGTTVGGHQLILQDVVNISNQIVYLQGAAIGDDVPLSIQVFNANTNDLAGLEALSSTIDVDPSGVYMASTPFTITSFETNRSVGVRVAVLFDDENIGSEGESRATQFVRAGKTLSVPMQVMDAGVLTLPNGASETIQVNENTLGGSLRISGVAAGVTTVSIVSQPTGFTAPTNETTDVTITVEAPDAFLRSNGSISYLAEAVVGEGLQQSYRVRLTSEPPSPVDIVVSVPPNSGVLLSADSQATGSTSVTFSAVTGSTSAPLYIQGVSIGDDVPLSVAVLQSGTQTPAGYNVLSSTVDIDPSGLYVNSSDYNTTTFSTSRAISVTTVMLCDDEDPPFENQACVVQALRGGTNLSVPMTVDQPSVASLPAGASDTLSITGGSTSGSLQVDPIAAGQALVSIASLPAGFVIPSNRNDSLTVTVTAPNAFLRSAGSASYQREAIIGIDLQTQHYIGLAVTPPAATDIRVSVPAGSGVLLSLDPSTVGGTQLDFENVTTTRSPTFYIQGTQLGDDVPVAVDVFEAGTETPIGYTSQFSTVDVDPSGVYMRSGDFNTNTFAANRSVQVGAALLYDDELGAQLEGWFLRDQSVRGGISLTVPMTVADSNVIALPNGSTGNLTIMGGQSNGTIEADPLTVGETQISIVSQPNANFSLPSTRSDTLTATVSAPNAFFTSTNLIIGNQLQDDTRLGLAEIPPNPVTVTVESLAPSVALISKDPDQEGSATLTFENVTGASVGTIYVQGLTLNGATQLRISALGYADGSADVEIVPSGFQLTGSFSDINAGNTRNLSVRSARLLSNGVASGAQAVRGGQSFTINLNSSDPAVGTVTTPVTLNGGESSATSVFSAIAPGTTNIQVLQPSGFQPPVGTSDADITVN